MLALKVEKRFAENAKQELLEKGAFARGFGVKRDEKFVFFPVSKRVSVSVKHSFVNKVFDAIENPKPLKALARGAPSSFDLVGDIAIIETPANRSRCKYIAKRLLASNKRIKTVLRKASGRKGDFRLRDYEWLAGGRKTLTLHKESGCVFKVDLAKAYFSPRLSAERLRVASKVKNGENVLVLFAGVSPFDIVIAKRKKVLVKGVELNRAASKLAEENVRLNKLEGKCEVINGEAGVYARKLGKWADRIVMVFPKGAHRFLDLVVGHARKGCIVHYYDVGGEREGFFAKALERIEKACLKNKRKFRVLSKRKVLPYAPRVFTVAIDFKVL
ncbi:MAG: class I SAM-dependent methyltransferase family protein [Candidatus Norongarragalinales archaeon]